ncbi:MFS transporter [Corallococcus macrosporus]|uniref:MFS transporter n=1 Tax=Corallococcus macrosporus DSM 14697 TaxID=1189310 RepID=A0A250JZB9_9BACT|nr:MFS transporter [Corallococcus macrosporus]ATB48691.1 MFS transporter [Corallococcus macrosporus DSM 14697]
MTAAPSFPLKSAVAIWLGQVLSLLGSGLTSFALGVWTYKTTGDVTQYALVMLAATLPGILLGPVAGALVDRWNRRWVMVLSDTAAGLSSLALALLLFNGLLQPWHAYVTTAVVSTASAFQQPAFAVLVSTVVPQQHLGRANGLVQVGLAFSQLVAPLLSATLLEVIELKGILLIDATTLVLGTLPLLLARISREHLVSSSGEAHPSLLESVRAGGAYLRASPGLLALIGFLAVSNFLTGTVEVLVTPLVLSFADVRTLGALTTAGGVGMLGGSVLISAWGGPKRLVHGVLGFQFTCGLALVCVGLATAVPVLAGVAFAFFFGLPIINGASQALLQRIVPLALRGRVFAFTGTITGAMLPLAYSISGPLADHVFEPAMASGGSLVPLLGPLLGEGPGRGIALMFVIAGALSLLLTLLSTLYRPLRELEAPLPDAPSAAPAMNP